MCKRGPSWLSWMDRVGYGLLNGIEILLSTSIRWFQLALVTRYHQVFGFQDIVGLLFSDDFFCQKGHSVDGNQLCAKMKLAAKRNAKNDEFSGHKP